MPVKTIKIALIVGARPNFIKIAPLFWEFKKHKNIAPVLIHTGQHYDYQMSEVFFKDLNIPNPDYNLGVGSGTHGFQTGQALVEIEKVLMREDPQMVIVVGDVNSTLAGALAAAKLHIPVAHIEAGLRSFDKSMPEEINRVLTDHISDFLFCPTPTAVLNLKREGIARGVLNTGDIMLDVLKIKLKERKSLVLEELKIKPKSYLLLTIHRPANVDKLENFIRIMDAVSRIGEKIILPLHPRAISQLRKIDAGRISFRENIQTADPVGYLEMLALEKNAKKIITDSGGAQKEAFWLKVPCITLRKETEWVETVKSGWNILAGGDAKKIIRAARGADPIGSRPAYYGNGRAAEKIVKAIGKMLV